MPLITRLWSSFRDALTRLCATLAPLHTQTHKERRDLRRTLTALEAFARRIVLLEAMSLSHLDRGSSDAHASLTRLRRSQASASPRGEARGPRSKARRSSLRLWPRFKRSSARIRQLGPPALVRDIWREQYRAALIARLKSAPRRPITTRLADRIGALENILAAPLRAAKRLARTLVRLPSLALKLVMARIRSLCGVDPALYDEMQDALFTPALKLNSS